MRKSSSAPSESRPYSPMNGTTGLDQFTQTLLNFAQLSPNDTATTTSTNGSPYLIPRVSSAAAATGGASYSYPFWALARAAE